MPGKFSRLRLPARAALHLLTDDDIRLLTSALEANQMSIGDQQRFVKTDLDFHFAIAGVAKNPIFTSLMMAVDGWLGTQRDVSAQGGATQSVALCRTRKSILASIVAHDPDRAAHAMREHLETVVRQYWLAVANIEPSTKGALKP